MLLFSRRYYKANLLKAQGIRHKAKALKKFRMPKVLVNSFLVSIPVLKEHDNGVITASLKNLIGIAPSKHYRLVVSKWQKAKLHLLGLHKCIHDINLYKSPDLSVVDGAIGQRGNEINGLITKMA